MALERTANPWSCIRLVGSNPTLCVLYSKAVMRQMSDGENR